MDSFVFPDGNLPDEVFEKTKNMGSDEAGYYHVMYEDKLGLTREVPNCRALAEGGLPSQFHLASGPPRFGSYALGVGDKVVPLMGIKQIVHRPDLKIWADERFPDVFKDCNEDFLLFEFRHRPGFQISAVVLGFKSSELLQSFARTWEETFVGDEITFQK